MSGLPASPVGGRWATHRPMCTTIEITHGQMSLRHNEGH